MVHGIFHLWEKEEYIYPAAGDFIPNVAAYLHEDDIVRPAMLVVPGGSYCYVSPSEGEIVARSFFDKGYNAFVVTYTTNLLMDTPLKLQPLKNLSKAVKFVRKNAEQFGVEPGKVAVCGFSAGGHLSASLAVHFDAEDLQLGPDYEGISSRPDAVILSYPVITTGEYAHEGSIEALLGPAPSAEELAYMSLETQVTKDMPPVFLWHTATDGAVPVENSKLFAEASKEHGVPFELHVFGNGAHGLSLANEEWASGNFGGDYTLEQVFGTLQHLLDNGLQLPDRYKHLGEAFKNVGVREALKQDRRARDLHPDEGIAIWPELANNWLKKVL